MLGSVDSKYYINGSESSKKYPCLSDPVIILLTSGDKIMRELKANGDRTFLAFNLMAQEFEFY